MRLVLDQGVPRDAAVGLRRLGLECVHVGEAGVSKAGDGEILTWSGQGSIAVTLDADFHTILAVSGARGPSVIRFRIEGLRAPQVVSLIQAVLADFESDLEHGSLITVRPHKIACHRLPIGGDRD